MKTHPFLLTSILFLFGLNTAIAQQKYEREFSIKKESIPSLAQQFIDSIGPDSNIKWYREISLETVSIEAKFKKNKEKFSVEFDTLGVLEDVEIEIASKDIQPEIYAQIVSTLDSLYRKWKFQKIQENYPAESFNILNTIKQRSQDHPIKPFYEIVLIGKIEHASTLFELTFNELGKLIDVLEIIPNKSDHLEY